MFEIPVSGGIESRVALANGSLQKAKASSFCSAI